MTEHPHPRQTYIVLLLGAQCEHRWRGTVRTNGLGGFTLDRDDGACPECGGIAGVAIFGACDGCDERSCSPGPGGCGCGGGDR